MITVKERLDYKEEVIDKLAIYDLYSKLQGNKKPLDSSSTASVGNIPMTTRGHYQTVNYSITDLIEFVKNSMTKMQ